ncbi:hypothetical protein [Janthinobacterium sp. 17J80-10]|uniref:hypothetical protein n=1 Tax=Janthinobacterium sp. 17J80-10 TaxID=2497863 RepID=UPI0010056D01|nr:hypothetical protein [Janthinobacterium sp. 17J80-10]QAU34567.1 hypothetical protein EKL02_10455 [Janthinobacterium sp. 17J80-10]
MPILAAWCLTSAGSNLDDFRQALIDKTLRPLPDHDLLDEDGYPLFAARIRDLDAGLQEPQDDTLYSAAFSRTLSLLSRLMEQVEVDWPIAAPALEGTAAGTGMATLRGSDPATMSPEPRLRLQIKLVTPAEFTPDEQRQALDWLNRTVTTLPVAPEDRHVEAISAQDDATPLLLAERFRSEAGAAGALLILAADSGLCPATTERLEGEKRLFRSHRPHGLMPGEAAFAILCINQKALRFALQQPACILQRVASCRRAASADDGARPSHVSLGAATGAALDAANLTGEAISAIACDADHRSSRVLECIGAMLQHTPQLDAIANRLAVNETCGHIGAASSAGGWVAGIAQAQSAGQPVLVFNVSHAFERAAAVLLPANDDALPA